MATRDVGRCTPCRLQAATSRRPLQQRHCLRLLKADPLPARASSGHRNGSDVEDLASSLPSEDLTWSVVEFVDGCLHLVGGELREVGLLREVLAQQPVRVLVAAALPGAVRVAEVDGHACRGAEVVVLGQLDAAVLGQGSTHRVG